MSPKYFLASERLNWNRSQLAWAWQKLALQLLAQKLFAQSGCAMGKTAGNKELKHSLEVVSGQWLLVTQKARAWLSVSGTQSLSPIRYGLEHIYYHGHAFYFFFKHILESGRCRTQPAVDSKDPPGINCPIDTINYV